MKQDESIVHFDKMKNQITRITFINEELSEEFKSNMEFEGQITDLKKEFNQLHNDLKGRNMTIGRLEKHVEKLNGKIKEHKDEMNELRKEKNTEIKLLKEKLALKGKKKKKAKFATSESMAGLTG